MNILPIVGGLTFTFLMILGPTSLMAVTYEEQAASLSPAEQNGRDIWYKATAGNKRHHSYVLQQRFNAPLDFHGIMGTQTRGKRFQSHGLINDPDCKPGTDASYGFDICPGDEELLKFVGKKGYRDPACSMDANPKLESACGLEFGTSVGVIGFRKFPNPRFNSKTWKGWDKWNIQDASVEPPFTFGTTCASCHVGFDPKHPPANREAPEWANIDGTIGNIFMDNTAIFTSGLRLDKPLGDVFFQTLTHVRPGTTDTSAIPNDNLHNTGTFNAIINFDKRPTFEHDVKRWRRDAPGEPWSLSTQKQSVMQILKGGEDSVGEDLAIMRVYVNIGMCSEKCWQNNLVNPHQYSGYYTKQKPFEIAQCRRDCSNWRAMEDRVGDVAAFILHRRPSDLKDAVNSKYQAVGESHLADVKAKFDPLYAESGGVFEEGRKVFAKNCATCHSSQQPKIPGQPRDEKFFASLNFLATDSAGVRIDWLGNDERTDASKVDSHRCRALHSNHNKGHIWEQFASETFHATAAPSGVPELVGKEAGGPGFYRNISLLSVWAHAPFMHNNALGPEFCTPNNKQEWACVDRDPSVEARIARYEASMRDMLYPEERIPKITRTTENIGLTLKFPLTQIQVPTPITLNLPKGTPVALLGSLDLPRFANDQINGLKDKLEGKNVIEATKILTEHVKGLLATNEKLIENLSQYTNCQDLVENKGHTFGAELSDAEKTALIQYMKNF